MILAVLSGRAGFDTDKSEPAQKGFSGQSGRVDMREAGRSGHSATVAVSATPTASRGVQDAPASVVSVKPRRLGDQRIQHYELAAIMRKLRDTLSERYLRAFEAGTMPEDTCAPRIAVVQVGAESPPRRRGQSSGSFQARDNGIICRYEERRITKADG